MMSNGNEHFSKILNLNPKNFSFLTKSGHRKYRVVSLDEDLKVDVYIFESELIVEIPEGRDTYEALPRPATVDVIYEPP
jgi:hypothetical protein